jgi:hypothetical protein
MYGLHMWNKIIAAVFMERAVEHNDENPTNQIY